MCLCRTHQISRRVVCLSSPVQWHPGPCTVRIYGSSVVSLSECTRKTMNSSLLLHLPYNPVSSEAILSDEGYCFSARNRRTNNITRSEIAHGVLSYVVYISSWSIVNAAALYWAYNVRCWIACASHARIPWCCYLDPYWLIYSPRWICHILSFL